MACYKPIPAYNDGKGKVILNPPLGASNLALPCGKCIGCKATKATEWARRCEHEAKLYKYNTFLTLTYDDDRLPTEGLRSDHLSNFIKRLRKRASDNRNNSIVRDNRLPIRYFACGEYGEHTARPHYHALLFNTGFSDRHRTAVDLYESDILKELWPYGQHKLGDATPAAANYIAQYQIKKQGRYKQDEHTEDGLWIQPPFLRMSRDIGKHWVEKYHMDLIHGYMINNGVKTHIPRRYKDIIKEKHPEIYEEMRANVARNLIANPSDKNEPARLEAAEKIHTLRKTQQEREL